MNGLINIEIANEIDRIELKPHQTMRVFTLNSQEVSDLDDRIDSFMYQIGHKLMERYSLFSFQIMPLKQQVFLFTIR